MCEKYKIPHKKVTKWIVSNSDEESVFLENMKKKSEEINQKLYFITHKEAKNIEPNVEAQAVLVSPETGIVDSHELMNYFKYETESNGGDIVVDSEIVNIEKDGFSYIVSTRDFKIRADIVVNCAGLYSDYINNLLIKDHPKQLYHFKGQYFSYCGEKLVSRLIYPAPPANLESLGIHLTLDLSGQLRFGPDSLYIGTEKNFDYSVNQNDIDKFYSSIQKYLPKIEKEKLVAGYSGIRPKLSLPGGQFKDFYIEEETKLGFDGFVNLIGIESPGLTSCISIADHVATLLGYKI